MTRRHATPAPLTPPGSVWRYHGRIVGEGRQDPYQRRGKYKEPTVCGECGAVYENARWTWGDARAHAQRETCPACARTRDKLPAGRVTLSGEFFDAHRAELLQLARNAAERERTEHPLHRVMQVTEGPSKAVITTCDIHSPQRIGEALERAYHGDLDICYGHDEYSVRVDWRR